MREFWVASGHHLTTRTGSGGLAVTPELLMAYFARPELLPPDEACDAERALHAALMADPMRRVAPAEIAALADADARENWTFMLAFRDRLRTAGTLEAAYLDLARKGAGGLPPIFLNQLCQLVLRNALEGCDDPFLLRAGETFYRPQKATVHEGTLLLADAEVVEVQQAQSQQHAAPLTALLDPVPAFGDLDIMDEDNAWTYWSRSDANTMIFNIGGQERARAALARVCERWIAHLLGIEASIEPVAKIEDPDWRWFVGLDGEATRIGNALWQGARFDAQMAERIVVLMRMRLRDEALVEPALRGKPVYLIGAMDEQKVWRVKPQNLLVGLPLVTKEPS